MCDRSSDPSMHEAAALPYLWQCEATRCWRQRDRLGHWHPRGRDMGTDDPGTGNRYHPECRPQHSLWETANQ